MKTTVELPEDLAREARQVAAQCGTTLRSLMEEGLRRELARRAERPTWQPTDEFAYGTGGLTAYARSLTWTQIRDEAMTR